MQQANLLASSQPVHTPRHTQLTEKTIQRQPAKPKPRLVNSLNVLTHHVKVPSPLQYTFTHHAKRPPTHLYYLLVNKTHIHLSR